MFFPVRAGELWTEGMGNQSFSFLQGGPDFFWNSRGAIPRYPVRLHWKPLASRLYFDCPRLHENVRPRGAGILGAEPFCLRAHSRKSTATRPPWPNSFILLRRGGIPFRPSPWPKRGQEPPIELVVCSLSFRFFSGVGGSCGPGTGALKEKHGAKDRMVGSCPPCAPWPAPASVSPGGAPLKITAADVFLRAQGCPVNLTTTVSN